MQASVYIYIYKLTCIKVVLPEPAMPMHKTTGGCLVSLGVLMFWEEVEVCDRKKENEDAPLQCGVH